MLTSKGLLVFAFVYSLYAQPNVQFAPGSLRPDGAYQAGNGVSSPSVVFRTSCDIPDLARKLRAQGEVTLSVIVNADGTVRDVQTINSAGYGMDQRASECVKNWRFKPGTKAGSPVDVAFRFAYSFGLTPEPRVWGAGPLIFNADSGTTPPVLKSGAAPTEKRDPGDEVVLFEFAVSSAGEVDNIQALEGANSTSLPLLTKSLAKWKFAPALSGTQPTEAAGKVLFIKGGDQFRYQVSKSFRDSGDAHPPEAKPANTSNAPGSFVTIRVPLTIELDPNEATKQLIHRVPPEYPAEAGTARIQGTVSLLLKIGKDGSVTDVKEISGPPELISAAVAAVKQWRYNPILLRGEPQQATTVVEIPFKLADQ